MVSIFLRGSRPPTVIGGGVHQQIQKEGSPFNTLMCGVCPGSRRRGTSENSEEAAELEMIADAMDAYDTMARLAPLLK